MAKKMRTRAPKEFLEELVQLDRVSYVVKGGRRMRFRATMLIGDEKGRVGYGIGKANEVVDAIRKGVADAKRNLHRVDIANETIPHTVRHKFKSSEVLLMPAPAGKGVVAGGVVRKVCQVAGVPNILSKTYGSRNKVNLVRATIEGLASSRIFDGLKIEKSFEDTIREKEEQKKKEIERAAAEQKAAKDAAKKRKAEEEAAAKKAEAEAEAAAKAEEEAKAAEEATAKAEEEAKAAAEDVAEETSEEAQEEEKVEEAAEEVADTKEEAEDAPTEETEAPAEEETTEEVADEEKKED